MTVARRSLVGRRVVTHAGLLELSENVNKTRSGDKAGWAGIPPLFTIPAAEMKFSDLHLEKVFTGYISRQV